MELEVEARPAASQACALSGNREVLAWKSSGENIGICEIFSDGVADIGNAPVCIWEVASKNTTAVMVDLDLLDGLDARPLQTQVEAADSGEKGDAAHGHSLNSPSSKSSMPAGSSVAVCPRKR
jgi:hypothetical protein